MTDTTLNKRTSLIGGLRKSRFFRRGVATTLLWPMASIVLAGALWCGVWVKLDHDRERVQREVFKNASSLSKAYAEQLARSLQQIDQIALHVKYDWVKSNGRLDLREQAHAGLYPSSARLYVGALNRHGTIMTAAAGDEYRGVRVSPEKAWFKGHKSDPARGLLISDPDLGIFTNNIVIRFTRRLNAADGSFDGVVMVTAEAAYFATLADEANLGKRDSLLVARSDGQVLTAKNGAGVDSQTGIFLSPPIFGSIQGNLRMAREIFHDNEPRIVAWHKVSGFPLVSVVALNEKDAFAAYEQKADEFRIIAVTLSALLLLSAAIGTVFSSRLASRKHQAEEIKNAYRLATDGAREGFYMLRAVYDDDHNVVDFVIKDCNERGAAYYGISRAKLIGMRFSSRFLAGYEENVMPVYRRAMEIGFHESELPVTARSSLQVAWIHRRLVRSGEGLAVTLRDISETKAHEEALSRLANADAVTTLPNRHWLMNHLPAAVERARNSNSALALLFVDLDDFKNINDTLGHAAGDQVLRAVALRLESVVRPEDNVVRLGGDEFTIVLERIHSNDDISRIATRVIESFANPLFLGDGNSHHVSASVGISVFPHDGDDVETLLKHADIAMYAAKANGKNHYEFYQRRFSENLVTRLRKEQALRNAIENDEFLLYYQPRVDTSSGELRGLEALVRWLDPELGLVPPNEFIPIAEDTGLIVQLGELIIKKACADVAQWKGQRLPVVPVSINVSPRQFSQGGLSTLVRSCIAHYGLDPHLIQIEITESCMMGQDEQVTAELTALRALGIKLYVDDFGTGYSSMSQLQRLKLDGLKVDQAFTAQLGGSKEGEVFFMAILSMAHVLGMTLVAEGVETPEQLRALQAMSCDEIQGYLISKPMPADEIVALMKKRFLFPTESVSLALA
jgi:diguanylate cyclase (GGDEF)-like protein